MALMLHELLGGVKAGALIKVKPDKLADYEALAAAVDEGSKTEVNMLHHTFNQDPDEATKFSYVHVYPNDEALVAHLTNPEAGKYIEANGDVAESFTIELHGTICDATKEVLAAAPLPPNFAVRIFDTKLGYSMLEPRGPAAAL